MTTAVVVKADARRVTAFKNRPIPRRLAAPNNLVSGRLSDAAHEHQSGAPSSDSSVQFETPRASIQRQSESSRPVCIWKRGLDVICILISLPLTLPLIAMVVLWIKLVSRGPAIFRQERIGRNGRRFILYKFRSMHVDADTRRHASYFSHLVKSDSPMVKLDLLSDSRLIPAGCLLRAAGLDELPQLFNVLRGEMSLVGPRPCLPDEYRYFSRSQRVRFEALPGLTGIWQTQGKELSTFAEMNEMDARYVRCSSPLLDLAIMLRTPCAVLRQMRLACQRHRASAAAKTSFDKPGYSTQRMG